MLGCCCDQIQHAYAHGVAALFPCHHADVRMPAREFPVTSARSFLSDLKRVQITAVGPVPDLSSPLTRHLCRLMALESAAHELNLGCAIVQLHAEERHSGDHNHIEWLLGGKAGNESYKGGGKGTGRLGCGFEIGGGVFQFNCITSKERMEQSAPTDEAAGSASSRFI